MQVTGQTTKVAWIRDRSVPQGQPAFGQFGCPCGDKVADVEFGGRNRTCDSCGRVFDGYGWIISQPGGRS